MQSIYLSKEAYRRRLHCYFFRLAIQESPQIFSGQFTSNACGITSTDATARGPAACLGPHPSVGPPLDTFSGIFPPSPAALRASPFRFCRLRTMLRCVAASPLCAARPRARLAQGRPSPRPYTLRRAPKLVRTLCSAIGSAETVRAVLQVLWRGEGFRSIFTNECVCTRAAVSSARPRTPRRRAMISSACSSGLPPLLVSAPATGLDFFLSCQMRFVKPLPVSLQAPSRGRRLHWLPLLL